MTSIKDTFVSSSTPNGITLMQLDAKGDPVADRTVHLTPDDCMGLFHTLWTELRTMNFPEMIVRRAAEDDDIPDAEEAAADDRVVMECPRCHAVAVEDGFDGPVEIVDLDIRHTEGTLMGGCTVASPELSVNYDSETNYELLYVVCRACGDGVRLPDSVTEHS